MKILFIACDYLPGSTRIATRMRPELAREFVARGHDVVVVTPDPAVKKGSEIEVLDNVEIWKFHSGPIQNVSRARRAINETMLSRNAWKALKKQFKNNRHDLIVYNSPSIFWGTLAGRLKRLWQAPTYLILRDIFPQWVVDNGILRRHSPQTYYFEFFEWLNYRSADRIGLQSVKGKEWFARNRVKDKRLDVVYNWANDEPKLDTDSYFRKKLGLEDKVVFFYGGNIGYAQDIMNIVRLAENMRNESNAVFVLVGKGEEVSNIKSVITERRLTNIIYLPPVDQNVFDKMLAEFDVGLFSLHRDHTTHNFPGKLLGYMVQAMPILGSINPGNDLLEMVDKAQAGFITVNGDDDGFKQNALKLVHDETLRSQCGQGAKELLHEYFSVSAAADTILSAFEIEA